MKKATLPLVMALLASTTFIVNCQKAPSKRSTPTSGPDAGAAAAAGVGAGKATANVTEVCVADVKAMRANMKTQQTQISALVAKNQKDQTDEVKSQIKDLRTSTLKLCDNVIAKMKSINGDGCLMEKGKTDAILKVDVQNYCDVVGADQQAATGERTVYSANADLKKAREQEDNKLDELKKERLFLTKAGKESLAEKNINWKSFLDKNGEIKSSPSELEQISSEKKHMACSFDKAVDSKSDEVFILQTVSYEDNKKTGDVYDNSNVSDGFKGNSIVVRMSQVDAGSDSATTNLVCINVTKNTLTVEQLKKVISKVMSVGKPKAEGTSAVSGTATVSDSNKINPTTITTLTVSGVTKPVSAAQTVTVQPIVPTSPTATVSGKTDVATNVLKVTNISASGDKLIIDLDNGAKAKIASGSLSLSKGSEVVVESKDGKKYLLTADRKNKTEIIEESETKVAKKEAVVKKASGAPAVSTAGEGVSLQMSTTLSQVPEVQKSDVAVVSGAALDDMKNKVSQVTKLASISFNSATRTQIITLSNGAVLEVMTSRTLDQAFVDSVTRLEYDKDQATVKDSKTGKTKYIGRLVLAKTNEVIPVSFTK